MSFRHVGSISHGTMREADLVPDFAALLETISKEQKKYKQHRALIREAESIDFASDYAQAQASEVLESLFEALNECAPDYFYFGAHPGDGSDYGFWLSEDWQENAREDDYPMVNDSSELPKPYCGIWFSITNHGNVTMYVRHRNHRNTEIWSVV